MIVKEKNKPAARGVAEKRVLDQQHETLLTWTLANLTKLVASGWSLKDDQLPELALKAQRSTLKSIEKICASASRNEPDYSMTDEEEEAAKNAPITAENQAVLDAAPAFKEMLEGVFSDLKVPKQTTQGLLEKHVLMEQVFKLEPRQYGDYKKTPAGFIDIQTLIYQPESLSVIFDGDDSLDNYENPLSEIFPFYLSKEFLLNFGAGKGCKTPRYKSYGKKKYVWFTVRSDAFTLGQIMQELRTLSGLDDGNQEVVLVVNEIDQTKRAHIEREGFKVFERKSIENEMKIESWTANIQAANK